MTKIGQCPFCGGPGPSSEADTAYCSEECASNALVEGWNSMGESPQEQLIAMETDAPMEDVLKYFDEHGSLGSFARKEMPQVCLVLGIKTIGDLTRHTRAQLAGPQGRFAGNKTLEWVEMVLRQFGKSLQVPLGPDELAYIASHGISKF